MHVHCSGSAVFYGHRFGCWVPSGHGNVELPKAIYQSCDVFFYTLAEKLGIDRIAKYAQAFGLGKKTGIDLPQEVAGVMPSEEWKARLFKQKWFAGETISVGIGQGAVATTPVQLARTIGDAPPGGTHGPRHASREKESGNRRASQSCIPGSARSFGRRASPTAASARARQSPTRWRKW